MVDRVKHAMSALVIVQGNILLLFSPNQKLMIIIKKKKKKIESSRKASTSRQCRNVGHWSLNVTGSNSASLPGDQSHFNSIMTRPLIHA